MTIELIRFFITMFGIYVVGLMVMTKDIFAIKLGVYGFGIITLIGIILYVAGVE